MPRPSKHDGVVYQRNDSKIWWMRYRDKSGRRRFESTQTEDWHEAQRKLRERLQARDNNLLDVVRKGEQLLFNDWADFFLEHYSKPPIRAAKTHAANLSALKSLRPVFGPMKITDIDATQIEVHLRSRLKHRRRVRRKAGVVELGTLKPAVVHQEFRDLRRIFSVAVKKKLCPTNPMCRSGVPSNPQEPVPAALHDLVGAAEDRAACSRIPSERDPNCHGDRSEGIQRTGVHAQGRGGPCEQAHLR